MSKLELKHLAPYLPYGVIAIDNSGKEINLTDRIYSLLAAILTNYRLILHPLSDLVKPCLPEGKIPIVELAKIVFDKRDNPDEFLFQSLKEDAIFIAFPDKRNVFGYDSTTKSFFGSFGGMAASVVNQLTLFEWLYEHHFDLHNLIEQGLAIDINTLQI